MVMSKNCCNIKCTKHFWKFGLPEEKDLEPNSIYFIKSGAGISMYVTGEDKSLYPVGTDSTGGGGITTILSPNSTISASVNGTTAYIDINPTLLQQIQDDISNSVQSVTGDGVDNTDPRNPVLILGEVALSNDYNDLDNLPSITGSTDLDYIATPTEGEVTSSTGNSATIPLADNTNAGLITPQEKQEISSALQPNDDISELNNNTGYITDYTVTENDVTQHQSALTITESQISDLSHFSGSYNDLTNVPTLDNYQNWQLWSNGVQRTSIGSLDKFDLVAGNNIDIAYSAGGVLTVDGITNISDLANDSKFIAEGSDSEQDIDFISAMTKAELNALPSEDPNTVYLTEKELNPLGYIVYNDDQYTEANPFVITQGSTEYIPNNAATVDMQDAPETGDSFYDGTYITPQAEGDKFHISVRFKIKSSVNNGGVSYGLDIGFAENIYGNSTRLLRGANTETALSYDISPYVRTSFLANKGRVAITAELGDLSIYDINYIIEKTYSRA